MARYIDADLIFHKGCVEVSAKGVGDFINHISNIPTADVVEVVHGEWIYEVGSFSTQSCSNCNWSVPYFNSLDVMSAVARLYKSLHYCPNCGAKMDGKKVEQMTNEEAIKVLNDTKVMILKGSVTDLAKASYMAVKALEEQVEKNEILKKLWVKYGTAKNAFENCMADKCYQEAQLEQRTMDVLKEVIEIVNNGGRDV